MPWWKTDLYEEGLVWEFAPPPADGEVERTEDGELAAVVPLESLGVKWA